MMERLTMVLIPCFACALLFGAKVSGEENKPDRHAAAMKVIERSLDAAGGGEVLRAIRCLQMKGGQGRMLTMPSLHTDFYLTSDGRFKRVSGTEVILCDGEKRIYNAGQGEQPLPGDFLEQSVFEQALMRRGFSLLVWEDAFDRAEYLGRKRYGPRKEYVVLFPKAQDGHDVTVYLDTDTYRINRIVFNIEHERAKTLKRVTRLKDYRTFGNVTVPTTIYFERVGWKEEGLQLVISNFIVNPELDDAIFESAEMEYGTLTLEGDRLIGEVRADRFTLLHTNASNEDLAAIGIEDGDRVRIKVGECTAEAKYVASFTPSAEEQRSRSQNILCRHPNAGYTRLILLPVIGSDFNETFTFAVGDRFEITRAAAEDGPEEEPAKMENAR